MNKLWLCGMIRGTKEILEQTVAPYVNLFDGLIFVVDDRASLLTTNWLEDIKGDGKIITKRWVNDHAHTSNEVLLSGVMNYGDWFVWIDETDRLNPVFAEKLRENAGYWEKNGIGMVCLDHPFIAQFHDGLRFSSSPHWTLRNNFGSIVNLNQINGYRKENYVFNLRANDVLRSAILSPIKYWFCYPAFSNHTELLYRQFGDDKWQEHENLRIKFRIFCFQELGIPLTMEGLEKYLTENVGKYHRAFEHVIETEVNLKDAFRVFVLKQSWQELAANRFNWSYFQWKNTGQIQQPKTGCYVGVFNKYRLAQGRGIE